MFSSFVYLFLPHYQLIRLFSCKNKKKPNMLSRIGLFKSTQR